MNSEKGFSLIELLCVVAIIGLLATIALPMYSNYREKANYAAVVAECRHLNNAFIGYHQDNGFYPDQTTFDLNNFEPLRTAGLYHGSLGRKLAAQKADAYGAPNAAEFWLQVTQADNVINQFLVINSNQAPLAPGIDLRGVHLVRNGTLNKNL